MLLTTAGQKTEYASRLTPHASRLTAHGSRLTAHGSRLTAHGSRLTAHGSHYSVLRRRRVKHLTPQILQFNRISPFVRQTILTVGKNDPSVTANASSAGANAPSAKPNEYRLIDRDPDRCSGDVREADCGPHQDPAYRMGNTRSGIHGTGELFTETETLPPITRTRRRYLLNNYHDGYAVRA
jgi:hypothetical protein